MPDLYIASYGLDEKKGVYVVSLEDDKLTLKQHFLTEDYPSYLIRDNNVVYASMKNATKKNTGGGVTSFNVKENGLLSLNDNYRSSGRSYTHLCLAPKRDMLFAANYHMGTTAAYEIENTKVLRKKSVVHHEGNGPDPLGRQLAPHVHYVGITPDDKYVYAVDLGSDAVVLYTYEDCVLKEDKKLLVTPGSGPRHMIFSSDGNYAYIVHEIANTISVYRYHNERFSLLQVISTIPRHFQGDNSAAGIKMNSTEDYLFVSNRGHDSIAFYERNKENGKLVLLYMIHTHKGPRDFEVIDDKYIVAACEKDDMLDVLHFDGSKQLLEITEETLEVPAPVCVCK